ncbi:hypothetical protein Tco_0672523, partial [Tanacetum coccineum]
MKCVSYVPEKGPSIQRLLVTLVTILNLFFAEIIDLSSNSFDYNKGVPKVGPLVASVLEEGPSIQGLLDLYGYNTLEDYLSDTYFPSTDKDSTDEDTIYESNFALSKGIYVPVSQQNNPKVKRPISDTGCVLGLANVTTWYEILKKIRVRKPYICADKAKGKKGFIWKLIMLLKMLSLFVFCLGIKPYGNVGLTYFVMLLKCLVCVLIAAYKLQLAACICILQFAACICILHLQVASKNLQLAFAACICILHLHLAFAACICILHLQLAFATCICKQAIAACMCILHLQLACASKYLQ